MPDRTQRLRDPIHGLIVFQEKSPTDMLAWRLIQTPEFQRLRRIRQLGVSELVFPGATHTRFAHSIGVYHNARRLLDVIRREEGGFNEERAEVVALAALLHDIGHGPFSHAFEGAREEIARLRGRDRIDHHERFSANMILNEEGSIRPLLDARDKTLAQSIADLFAADDPVDIYHAVVSSSFDADRLDYLIRDRYMTGTAAGSIDEDWLIDTLDTHHVLVRQDDDPEEREIPTFVFKLKGRQAAEDFLLARHRMYTQVYLHKTTRGFERLLSAFFGVVGATETKPAELGLEPTNPLVRFLRADAESLEDYARLDDMIVWNAIAAVASGSDRCGKELASRLMARERLHCLDLSVAGEEVRLNAERKLDRTESDKLGKRVFKDTAPLSLYSSADGDEEKAHKMVRVRDGDGRAVEITDFGDSIISRALMKKTNLTRFYFLDADERDRAEKAMRGK